MSSTTKDRFSHTPKTVPAFQRALTHHLYYTRGQAVYDASPTDVYMALAYTVRDQLMGRWRKTVEARLEAKPRYLIYLSAEYLLGSQLSQNLLYTDTQDLARKALLKFDLSLEDYTALDAEPGLGNGGLGRLAACFLDSLATMDIPCVAHGIRYEFGIFKQSFRDGWQVESPDEWLHLGNPWEFPQPDEMVDVGFGGHTRHLRDDKGALRVRWIPSQHILGEPVHTMVPGYGTTTVNRLRLWRARASKEFDFQLFDVGDYTRAVEQKTYSENLTKVLYPNDNTPQGKELRLRQQYFFVACSLADVLRTFLYIYKDVEELRQRTVFQLNDTHPVLAIPELMRLLMDEHGLGWDRAWEITTRCFAYTCHTLLPEALEKWPVSLFGRLLPRHLEIVYEINHRFLCEVRERFPDDPQRLRRMSLIEEGPEKLIRMAHLAAVGSFSINGVARLQSDLLERSVLSDFHELWPEKFNNKTNGVTPRRFMRLNNPRLSRLISSKIGDGWITNLQELENLEPHLQDARFRASWRRVKQENKKELAAWIDKHLGIEVNTDSIFDIMVKRLHEYKRQLLKALHIITLYHRIKSAPDVKMVPRTFIFGAKAAPGYHMAKLIIKLINSVAEVVNGDPKVRGRLKVVFLPNFNVSLGEMVYPAADISEQISMAGKEASGTGNMKFALNGAITTGTLDGANIEIRERVGEENFFLFGLTADEVMALEKRGYNPRDYYEADPELKQAIDAIASGAFSRGDSGLFEPIVASLLNHDEYLLLVDYPSYVKCQEAASAAYRDRDRWTRMSILNVARCGFFSSDRTMRQYIEEIWKLEPVRVESGHPAQDVED